MRGTLKTLRHRPFILIPDQVAFAIEHLIEKLQWLLLLAAEKRVRIVVDLLQDGRMLVHLLDQLRSVGDVCRLTLN